MNPITKLALITLGAISFAAGALFWMTCYVAMLWIKTRPPIKNGWVIVAVLASTALLNGGLVLALRGLMRTPKDRRYLGASRDLCAAMILIPWILTVLGVTALAIVGE